MKKIIVGILALFVGVVTIVSFRAQPSESNTSYQDYKILEKWDLPGSLDEISGIAWIGDDRVACVQDEHGKIFVYNLKTSKVDNEISFSSDGDYEGIAVVESDAYVLRSDGVIFEVSDFLSDDPKVRKHVTQTNELPGINIEGLCADRENNRLLLAVKERKNFTKQKEIYGFDLDKRNSGESPLFSVNLADPIFKEVKGKQKENFTPGEIGVHPKTGEYYILDGTRPKLLITGKDGTPKELFMLRLEDFGNPEGLTFNPEGELFISNEAEDGPANILKISLKRIKKN